MFKVNFDVAKEIVIQSSAQQVYKSLINLQNWDQWSPWLCTDENAKTSISGQVGTVGHMQEWQGDLVGHGKNTIVKLIQDKQIDLMLEFIKPWKSQSQSRFILTSIAQNETKVRWEMQGNLPFFMIFFKKMMVCFIGRDFQRGLKMFKEYMETGKILAKTKIQGLKEADGFFYVGYRKESTMEQMPTVMVQDFSSLNQLVSQGQLPKPDLAISFYHKFDMTGDKVVFTSALAYKKSVTDVPEGLQSGEIQRHKSLQVMHLGSYEHLGNSWTAAMMYQRHKKIKTNKSIDMYEVYLNSPHEVSTENLKTLINIPARS